MSLRFDLIAQALPQLLEGLWLTLAIMLIALAAGAILAAIAAHAAMRGGRFTRALAAQYVWIFRGTPAIVQLFLIYYGLAQFGWLRETAVWTILREPFWCCVIAFALNSGAYTAEIIRGAIGGVAASQMEAAKALGLGKVQAFRLVVWPQAFRLALRPYSNEVIGMLKMTALASTVTLTEVTGVAETIASQTFAPYEIFISAAIVYLVLAALIEQVITALERRLTYDRD